MRVKPQNRRALKVEGGPFRYFTCSCGNYQATNPAMPWCSRCGVEYDIRTSEVILRPGRKTPSYAFGKALNKAGGVSFGRTTGKDEPEP